MSMLFRHFVDIFIMLLPCGEVTIVGGEVKINSGGSPGIGTDIEPVEALVPGESPKPKREKFRQDESNEPIDETIIGSGNFSEQFCVICESTGEPLSDISYRIRTQSGLEHEGKTDSDGKTIRVYTEEAEGIECTLL
jgi:type VI secretion system secreted protein VgrG